MDTKDIYWWRSRVERAISNLAFHICSSGWKCATRYAKSQASIPNVLNIFDLQILSIYFFHCFWVKLNFCHIILARSRSPHLGFLLLFTRDPGLPQWLSGKESACDAGNMGSIPGLGRSPGEGNGNALQYSCLGNPLDRGAWHGLQSMWLQRVGHD